MLLLKNKVFKKVICLILCVAILNSTFISILSLGFSSADATGVYKNATIETLNVKSYSVLDFDSGLLIIKSATGDDHYTIGNMVKIMTLYLTFEAIANKTISLESEVRVTKNAQNAGLGRESVFLDYGKKEVISVKQAIEAICVASANDAAYAISETLAMNEDAFVVLMNNKAKEFGMNNTCYRDSTGIKTIAEGQYSSANDIAILSYHLIKDFPDILEYTSMTFGYFEHTSTGQPNTQMISSNDMIRKNFYEACDGLITGYSKADGYAQCATAEVEGKREIAVVLGAETKSIRAGTLKFLIEYAVKNYEHTLIATAGTFVRKINVTDGKSLKVKTSISSDLYVTINVNDVENITSEIILDGEVKAPVEVGTKVGSVIYKLNDIEIGRADLVTSEKIERAGWFTRFIRMILEWLGIN